MHFEYQQKGQEVGTVVDPNVSVRNRGGGVPCTGRNGLMVETPASAVPLNSTDHQHQMRLLVLRERLRRALYN